MGEQASFLEKHPQGPAHAYPALLTPELTGNSSAAVPLPVGVQHVLQRIPGEIPGHNCLAYALEQYKPQLAIEHFLVHCHELQKICRAYTRGLGREPGS